MPIKNKNLLFPELSYQVVGLMYKTHNALGCYRNEKQYADYCEQLLLEEKISFQREKALPESFQGEKRRRNIPDFIVDDKIIVDFKAKRMISKEDYYQMQRYLSSYKKELGILINFRCQSISPKRILHASDNSEHSPACNPPQLRRCWRVASAGRDI